MQSEARWQKDGRGSTGPDWTVIADLLVGTTGPSEIVKQHAAVHQYPNVLAGVTLASAPVEYDPNIIDESDTVQCVGTCRWSLLVHVRKRGEGV